MVLGHVKFAYDCVNSNQDNIHARILVMLRFFSFFYNQEKKTANGNRPREGIDIGIRKE